MKKAKSLGLRKLRAENGRLKQVVKCYDMIAIRLGKQLVKRKSIQGFNEQIERKKWQGKELNGAYFIYQQEY